MCRTEARLVILTVGVGVGGGNAAGYLVRALVSADPTLGARTLVIGAEDVAPYERPALTKGFLHKESPPRLPGFHTCVGGGGERQTPEWYEQHGVELRLNTTVTAADFKSRTVTTSAGESIGYETLVLATGCGVIRLPEAIGGTLPGVHYVRNNADGLALVEAMDKATKAVVVGGGYVGLEVAASCATRGLKPEVVMMEPHVMARLWNADIAQHYERLYETRGTTFHRSSKLKAILADADGKARGIELESGAVIDADLVVVGVGATAPVPFTGLDAPEGRVGGIKVDSRFRASGADVAPGSVYAIGDIAAFPLKLADNEIVRMEHVKHARDSATLVGNIIAGKSDDEYDYTPFFYSRVFEHPGTERAVNWVFHGLQRGEIITIGNLDPTLAAFWIDDGKCVGIMLESGAPERVAALAAAVRARKSVDVSALRACASVDDALALVL